MASAVGAVVVLAMVLQVAAGAMDAALFPRVAGLTGERTDLDLWSQSVRRVVRAVVRRQSEIPQVQVQPPLSVAQGVVVALVLQASVGSTPLGAERPPLETSLPPPALV